MWVQYKALWNAVELKRGIYPAVLNLHESLTVALVHAIIINRANRLAITEHFPLESRVQIK